MNAHIETFVRALIEPEIKRLQADLAILRESEMSSVDSGLFAGMEASLMYQIIENTNNLKSVRDSVSEFNLQRLEMRKEREEIRKEREGMLGEFIKIQKAYDTKCAELELITAESVKKVDPIGDPIKIHTDALHPDDVAAHIEEVILGLE